MKKSFRILAAGLAASLALVSCDKESYSQSDNSGSSNGTRIITVSFSPESTRTVLDSDGSTPLFKEDDVILVSDGTDKQECPVKVKDGVGSIETALTGKLKAVYPAKAAKLNGNAIDGVIVSSSQSGKFEDANICMATIEEGATEAVFENQTALFHFVLEAGTGYTAKKLLVKSIGETPTAIADGDATEITIGDGTKTVDGVYMAVLQGVKISDLVVGAGEGRRYLNRNSDGTAQNETTIRTNYKYDVNIPVLNGHEYVELTIPVMTWDGESYEDTGSTKTLRWATTNVGATSETDKGLYFAWGETTGHTGYTDTKRFENDYSFSWTNCPFAISGDQMFNKYVPSDQSDYWGGTGSADNKTKLESSDDAATANWGSSWRMPTQEEFAGLAALDPGLNGWNGDNEGYRFTDANGNSIFLPAAGYGYGMVLTLAGVGGYYLSSSLSPDDPSCAFRLRFGNGVINADRCSERSTGFSVRPLSELK